MIIDASAALAWCFRDEVGERDIALLDRLRREQAVVPGIWHLELANALAAAERRGRIQSTHADVFIELISELDVRVDRETSHRAFSDVLALSRSQNLTAYDAAYVELAMRLGAPLASKDVALCQAALRLGVQVLAV